MTITIVALLAWTVLPDHAITGALCLLAGIANVWRLLRWRGFLTMSEPLIWVLHAGFLFVALGFFSVAADVLGVALAEAMAR